MIPIKPLEYKVLIEVRVAEATTAGGIILPDSVRDKQQQGREVGTIAAVGSMAFQDPDWPEHPVVGDTVLYNRYAGSIVRHAHKEYRLVNDKDIGAIVTDEFTEEIK